MSNATSPADIRATRNLSDEAVTACVSSFVDFAAGHGGLFSAAQATSLLGRTVALWTAIINSEARLGNIVAVGGGLYRLAR